MSNPFWADGRETPRVRAMRVASGHGTFSGGSMTEAKSHSGQSRNPCNLAGQSGLARSQNEVGSGQPDHSGHARFAVDDAVAVDVELHDG